MFLGWANGFYGFYGFYGEGGGFAAFFEGAMPEDLRIADLPFSMSSSLCFTASDKDPSATLRMTIRKNCSVISLLSAGMPYCLRLFPKG